MTRLLIFLLTLGGFALSTNTMAQEPLRIGGTGLGSLLIQRVLETDTQWQTKVRPVVMLPPLGSNGSLRALAGGTIQLAVVSIPSVYPATSATDNVRSIPWARTPFVFTGRGLGAGTSLTLARIADMYSGRVTQWPGGEQIRLVTRTDRESDTRLLRAMSPQIDAAVTLARKRVGMPFAETDFDNQELLEKSPGSFGVIGFGQLLLKRSTLKPVVLDAVVPSPENLHAGAYRFEKPLYLVVSSAPSAATLAFVEYLQSPGVMKIVMSYGFIPMPR
ncbi:MAG: substrate-binding domain-containing protein [Sterolibacterium sp.]